MLRLSKLFIIIYKQLQKQKRFNFLNLSTYCLYHTNTYSYETHYEYVF